MSEYLSGLFSLRNRVAVVTGGSSGIGRAIASGLSGAGAAVVLIARDSDRLAAAADDLRRERAAAEPRDAVGLVSADLGDPDQVQRAADAASAWFGAPDILVNCAGINLRPPLAELTREQWDRTMAVNLTAPFLLGQAYGPLMAAAGWGRIINVVSQQAFRAFGNSGGYGASKAALAALTRSQSEAWAPSGVGCNAIAPGFVATAMTREVADDLERSTGLAARTMIGRNGRPSDFEGTAVYLASAASDYVTGQVLFVDGGFSAT